MNMMKTIAAGTAVTIGIATAANADCGIAGGSVRVLANDFPALHAVVSKAEE